MRLGFICEGKTEQKIVGSRNFQDFLTSIGHTCVEDIIDAEGSGNLITRNLPQLTNVLESKGAERIIVITDLDEDACITLTKQRINAPQNHIVIVSVKKVEAWFLADVECMTTICGRPIQFELPESESNPFETIRRIVLDSTGRGIPTKALLTKRVIEHNFSVVNASAHPNCHSAKYLVRRLSSL